MNTLITFGYQAILFQGVPPELFEALSKATLVDVEVYGESRIFKPAKGEITVELIPEETISDDRPLLKALKEAQEEKSKEWNRRYAAESELKKLKERFGLQDLSKKPSEEAPF